MNPPISPGLHSSAPAVLEAPGPLLTLLNIPLTGLGGGFRWARDFTALRREIVERHQSGLSIIDIRHVFNLGRVAATLWITEGETRRPGRPFLGAQYSLAVHPGGLGEDQHGYH